MATHLYDRHVRRRIAIVAALTLLLGLGTANAFETGVRFSVLLPAGALAMTTSILAFFALVSIHPRFVDRPIYEVASHSVVPVMMGFLAIFELAVIGLLEWSNMAPWQQGVYLGAGLPAAYLIVREWRYTIMPMEWQKERDEKLEG